MGWDAFGLPAERAALRENIHPAVITKRNIANFKQQIENLGMSYDWEREICTSDPSYYKWTQHIFLKMYEKGLAYLADVAVNWCPAQGTVLANEEVVDGKYVETGDVVEKRHMKQWMLKITDYAEQLLAGLDNLDWPENVIQMQKNWIGKSQGANINFNIKGSDQKITVFTTKPETLYGVTFCVLAPDHPLLARIVTAEQSQAVNTYCQTARNLSDQEKEAKAGKEKTGINTGAFAYNPITEQYIPIWVADYVKLDYGSGAVMAVPAHDERDYEFAQTYDLPIIQVINEDDDIIMNSGLINGLSSAQARKKIISIITQRHIGEAKTTYKLRDWLFSRQRYWGEPFPIVYDQAGNAIANHDLPITLPEIAEFKPTSDGKPPLGRADDAWLHTTYNGQQVSRELNTMPQWAGSCWYHLRYMDPHNDTQPFSQQAEQYWGQVDLYIGGLEHAVSHLLYSRFWHKVLFDCGLVSHDEPFKKLFNQGMILGTSYKDAQGKYYHSDDVIEQEGKFYAKQDEANKLTSLTEKMSKSKLNVVNPDDIVAEYGADSLRLYEMFMGPLDSMKPWQTGGVKGVHGFLQRLYRISNDCQITDDHTDDEAILKELNITIAKVTEDLHNLKFNTAIAKMMECLNVFKTVEIISQTTWQKFILILAPFAPHLAEELWQRQGNSGSLAYAQWPSFDEKYLVADTINIVLCINGKKVDVVEAEKDISAEQATQLISSHQKIKQRIAGKQVVKTVFVPNKLINLIVKG
jgi:leucyl-tRNA synthetase